MAEELKWQGLFVDESYVLRVLEPNVAKDTQDLKEENEVFLESEYFTSKHLQGSLRNLSLCRADGLSEGHHRNNQAPGLVRRRGRQTEDAGHQPAEPRQLQRQAEGNRAATDPNQNHREDAGTWPLKDRASVPAAMRKWNAGGLRQLLSKPINFSFKFQHFLSFLYFPFNLLLPWISFASLVWNFSSFAILVSSEQFGIELSWWEPASAYKFLSKHSSEIFLYIFFVQGLIRWQSDTSRDEISLVNFGPPWISGTLRLIGDLSVEKISGRSFLQVLNRSRGRFSMVFYWRLSFPLQKHIVAFSDLHLIIFFSQARALVSTQRFRLCFGN